MKKEYRRDKYKFCLDGNLRQEGWEKLPTSERWKIQPIPNADSAQSLFQRMFSLFQKIASEHKSGDAVLCATHQANIRMFSLFCQLDVIENLRQCGKIDQIEELDSKPFKNCGFYQFRYDLHNKIFTYHGELKV